MNHQAYEQCIQACLECMEACNVCYDACLSEEDLKMMVNCIGWIGNVQIFVRLQLNQCNQTVHSQRKSANCVRKYVKHAGTNVKA